MKCVTGCVTNAPYYKLATRNIYILSLICKASYCYAINYYCICVFYTVRTISQNDDPALILSD